jgi:hypothetical protein
VPLGTAIGCGSMRSRSVRWLKLSDTGAAQFEGSSDSAMAALLVDPLPDVKELVWRVVALSAIWVGGACGI